MENPFFVHALKGMRSKKVALRLDKVGWHGLTAISIIITKGYAQPGHRDARQGSFGNKFSCIGFP